MKTAVSITDDVFEGAERLARCTGKSRSKLYGDALREYVARHSHQEITEAMDRVCLELQSQPADELDRFISESSRRVLEKTEW